MLTLRNYQREACDAFYAYLKEGGQAAVIELATGLGKSLVAATVCKELLARYPSARIVILAHVRELVAQNFKEMVALWPKCPAGINSAGLKRRDWRAQVLFAGIQSIHKRARLLGHVDLLIIDECHLLSAKSHTMYQRLIHELRDITPDMRLLGLSATPFRLDSGRLDEGDDRLFDKTIYSYGIAEGIKDGYLAPLISKAMVAGIDTSNVRVRAGEFAADELEEAALSGENVKKAIREIIDYGETRRAWLLFCSGVRHAQAVTQELIAQGVQAGLVTGEMDLRDRDERINAFKAGRLRALVNVNVLTTGFNVPNVDLIALLRPTQSPGLAIQQIGRGTRLAEGKDNCLILDFASILKTHGPVDQMAPPPRSKGRKKKPKAGMPVRICPECNGIMPIHAKICDQCGFEFKVDIEPSHDERADGVSMVLSDQEPPRWLKVHGWSFAIHQKDGRPPCLRIKYRVGVATEISEFLHFELTGYAREKAHSRWRDLAFDPDLFVPQMASEAHYLAKPKGTYHGGFIKQIESSLVMPPEIMVRRSGKYFEVVKIGELAHAA